VTGPAGPPPDPDAARPPAADPDRGGGRGPDPITPVVPVAPVTPVAVPPTTPGVLDLVARGARVGVDAAGLLAAEVADATVRIARAVLPPAVATGPLDLVGDAVERRRAEARGREAASADATVDAVQAVVRRVVELVIDQIDMSALVRRIPIDEVVDRIDIDAIAARIDVDAVVARVDVDAIVARIDVAGIVASMDLGAIVRDSTTGLAGETLDGIRVQLMGLDLLLARLVDRLTFRRTPRDTVVPGYDVVGPEIRTPRGLR
jgi:hypothetical protein